MRRSRSPKSRSWICGHVGIITAEQQRAEIYVAQTKVHVTNPAHHPYRVELRRFSKVSPRRQKRHIVLCTREEEDE